MNHKIRFFMALLLILMMASCKIEPKPIEIGKDACSFCKMGVVDKRFGAELITKKGKIYKFDDLHCLVEFEKGTTVKKDNIEQIYLINYEAPHGFIELQKSFLFKSETLRSPMGGNIAAFLTEKQLKEATQAMKGEVVLWSVLK